MGSPNARGYNRATRSDRFVFIKGFDVNATTDPRVRHWTRTDYYRMAEAGLFRNERVELVEGEILMMSPMKPAHAACLQLATKALERVFGAGHCVRVQLPLLVDESSEPEPDLAVVPGAPRDYTNHPRTALLVVEISDTTIAFDRGRKRDLYARAGVPEYWVVNLSDRCIELYRSPADAEYGERTIHEPSSTVTPLSASHGSIRVAEIMP